MENQAPWAGRYYHSTVIDAAGAIYVLGGYNGGTFTHYKDVWMGTAGGAWPDSRREYSGGTEGCSR